MPHFVPLRPGPTFSKFTRRDARSARCRRKSARIAVERLESRALLATLPVFGTGLTVNGTLASPGVKEAHFQLISAPYQSPQAYVLTSLPAAYTPNGPDSQWIGPSASPYVIQNPGDYTYRETFDLSDFDPSTAVLTGNLASDNGSRIVLNGVDTGITLVPSFVGASNTYDTLHPFTISSGFRSGMNTLDIIVNNEYAPTGLRVDLSGTGTPTQKATPALISAVQTTSGTLVTGQATGQPNTPYRIDFYTNPTANFPDPSNLPPSIDSLNVITDTSGVARFTTEIPSTLAAGSYVFATATTSSGLSSSLSAGQVVTASADLAVSSFVEPGTPSVDTAFPVSFVVTNNGPSPAADVLLNETLPSDVRIVAVEGSTGSVTQTGDVVTLHITGLNPGASAKLTVAVVSSAPETISASAVATSSAADTSPSNDSSRSLIPVKAAQFAPTVVALSREGFHLQPTFVTLRFSAPMASVPAERGTNYRVVSAGRDGQFGTKDDVIFALRVARYDAATNSVRLSFRHRLPLNRVYQITAIGTPPDGLTGQDGIPLGGQGASRPGTDFVTTFDRSALVRPAFHPARNHHH